MFNSSRRQVENQPLTSGIAGTEAAPAPMRGHWGESAEGWVTVEITPYPRPLRRLSHSNATDGANSFTDGFTNRIRQPEESLADYFAAQYAPPEAQFVLAVIENPGGPLPRAGHVRWADVEIVLRSPQAWTVGFQADHAPLETPELRRLVEELAAEAARQGWEPVGRGRTWCSLRFRQRR